MPRRSSGFCGFPSCFEKKILEMNISKAGCNITWVLDLGLHFTCAKGRSASRPAPRAAPLRNPPQPVNHAPPPVPAQGGGVLGGIGSTIAQGMAFGTGSAVAHRAVDAVMGPRTIQHETVVSEAAATAPTPNSYGSDACMREQLRERHQQVPVLHGHAVRVQEEFRWHVECLSNICHLREHKL
ncbi:hypothetical protein FNV43_RR22981 [Rhamnella rubrinervis]|uniref:Uncharacterized protein n=1 Tax=Rhamnella rubrinervis TaxID=2594499 RepID=A0A8K0DXM9_9ROSA|nr:hypothetical protein FNV43_RR22981 [Rhamnella rubrinervis]